MIRSPSFKASFVISDNGFGIRPDIMSMAKAIGSGIPVGAFAMTEEIAKYSLEPGDHGTTYGGNPLACTAVSKTIEIFEKKNLVAHVQELGAFSVFNMQISEIP